MKYFIAKNDLISKCRLGLILLFIAVPDVITAQSCGSIMITGCQTTIPANAKRVYGTLDTTGGYLCFWVCNGDSLFVKGVELSIWVEGGGFVSLGDSSNPVLASEIVVKDLGTVIFNGDTIHSNPPYNYVYAESQAIISDPKGISGVYGCQSILVDYSNVALAGCDTSVVPSWISEHFLPQLFKVVNHSDAWVIKAVSEDLGMNATLSNLSGRQVYQTAGIHYGEIAINKWNLAAGIYILKLQIDGRQRIIKLFRE